MVCMSAPKACLFSITRFLYGWQKIFTNKNIFSKSIYYMFCLYHFSVKFIIKIIYRRTVPMHKRRQKLLSFSIQVPVNKTARNLGEYLWTDNHILIAEFKLIFLQYSWHHQYQTVDSEEHRCTWSALPNILFLQICRSNQPSTIAVQLFLLLWSFLSSLHRILKSRWKVAARPWLRPSLYKHCETRFE